MGSKLTEPSTLPSRTKLAIAAERRQNAAQNAGSGWKLGNEQAPAGERNDRGDPSLPKLRPVSAEAAAWTAASAPAKPSGGIPTTLPAPRHTRAACAGLPSP